MAAVFLTVFQVIWAFVWGRKHLQIRRDRIYADGRQLTSSNKYYKTITYFFYLSGNLVCIASFWSNESWLLKVYDDKAAMSAGAVVITLATALYFQSLKCLGENYSPCYDSHIPRALVTIGPYKYIRHPMYLAKFLIAAGTFLLCGSLWMLPPFIYLAIDMIRTIRTEERHLDLAMFGFKNYQRETRILVPFIF